jgi:hypothetical protein
VTAIMLAMLSADLGDLDADPTGRDQDLTVGRA